jgi:hypothetical protein
MDRLLVDCGGQAGISKTWIRVRKILVLPETEGEVLGNASFAPGIRILLLRATLLL